MKSFPEFAEAVILQGNNGGFTKFIRDGAGVAFAFVVLRIL